jgi:hypothetical protein
VQIILRFLYRFLSSSFLFSVHSLHLIGRQATYASDIVSLNKLSVTIISLSARSHITKLQLQWAVFFSGYGLRCEHFDDVCKNR